jgi:phosphate/phosphite/phosphonate ABC transporter binding protein
MADSARIDKRERAPSLEKAQMGDTIGKYELISRLATGGMAEVFLARERGLAGLERLVVIKRMLPHLADDPVFVDMFLREARLIARINHPHIVHIHELGEEAGRYFIALEYIHGVTVRELQVLAAEQGRELPLEVSVAIAAQACRGLRAAHELTDLDGKPLGVIHRDISPHNLMCTSQGNIKLLDFGVAKITAREDEATYSGELKGKFSYMSPEQCMQIKLDQRSDIFSLGIVLWEMLTGRRLFKRASNLEMMQAITRGEVIPPSTYNEAVPAALDQVVLKALTTKPEDRWPSAQAMRKALMECAARHGWSDEPEVIAPTVAQIAGALLKERRDELERAVEGSAGLDADRLQLYRTTGSSSAVSRKELDRLPLPGADEEEEPATQVSRQRQHTPPTTVSRSVPSGDVPKMLADPPADAMQDSAKHTALSAPADARDEAAQKAPPKHSRLGLLALPALALIIALIALAVQHAPGAKAGASTLAPLKIVWAPTVDPTLLKSELAPLHKYLSAQLGREVVFMSADSYAAAAELLKRSKADLAMLPPLTYVRTHEEEPRIEPLVMRQFDGSTTSDGLLLVSQRTNAITTLEDLRGKKFCFPDPFSTTGYFLPRTYLRKQDLPPDEFIGEVHFSGDHIQVLRDLLEGRCDAGAAYSGAVLAADRLGIRVSQLRTLAVTGHVPQDVLCAAPDMPPAIRDAVRDALLRLDVQRDFKRPSLGDTQRITGFAPVTDHTFDALRIEIKREQRDQAPKSGSGHHVP